MNLFVESNHLPIMSYNPLLYYSPQQATKARVPNPGPAMHPRTTNDPLIFCTSSPIDTLFSHPQAAHQHHTQIYYPPPRGSQEAIRDNTRSLLDELVLAPDNLQQTLLYLLAEELEQLLVGPGEAVGDEHA